MAEVVNSLFGITPESLQAQRDQALQQEAMQYAKMDPFQRATAGIYSGASRLGGALGGMLGAQDPEMMRMQQRQGMLQNIDLTSPESLKQGIQTAMQNKDYQLVGELTNRYQQRTAAELAARKTEAEITAKTAEKKSFSVGDKAFLALAAKATPASVKAAQNADNDIGLLEVPEAVKVSTYGLVLKDAGLKEGTPEFQKQMQAFAAAELESTRKGKGTSVNVQVKQDEAVTKSNVEAFGKLRDTGIQAGQTLEAVKTIKPLIDQSFAGFASDSKLTAGQIAEAFGIPIKGTSETEQLRSLQNNLKIGNSTVLKGSLSDKDMAILGDAIGQGATTKAGLKGILSNLEKDALINQRQYQKANEYQQKGKLSEYDFVRGSEESRKEVSDKLKRLAELERKAKGQ